jgi:glutathione peroxidase
LVVLGVPSNDFGGQEPGNAQQIKEFCDISYKITFPLTDKTMVSGDTAHPFYAWAAAVSGAKPRWNFHKYLIGRDGKILESFNSLIGPSSMEKSIVKALGE